MPTIYTLSEKSVQGAQSLCLIKTQMLDFTPDMQGLNAIVLTSQNAVVAMSRHVNEWMGFEVFCVGEETARCVRELGVNVRFSQTQGGGRELGGTISSEYGHLRFFYPRGQKCAFDIEAFLTKHDIVCRSCVVYRTVCREDRPQELDDGCVVIFSSPSTVECFFALYEWRESYTGIALGETTLAALPKNINVRLCPKPSLTCAVELAASLEHGKVGT